MRRLRFGLLAVFATMLIVIGVAGWLRAELDLYREEQALVAEFAKAGCETHVHRGTLDLATLQRRQEGGHGWYEPDWLTRMSSLAVVGDPPEALLRRAAALPTLQALRVLPRDPTGPPPSLAELAAQLPTFPPSTDLLGRKLPEFGEPSIEDSAIDSPLPDGHAIEGAERDSILASVRAAWSRAGIDSRSALADVRRLPARYVKRIEAIGPDYGVPFDHAGMKLDLVRDGDQYWSVQRIRPVEEVENRLLTMRNHESEYGLVLEGGEWRLSQRADADVDPAWAQRIALSHAGTGLPRPDLLGNFPHSALLDRVGRIARIDQNRVRFDIEPGEIDVTRDPAIPRSYDVEEMALVL